MRGPTTEELEQIEFRHRLNAAIVKALCAPLNNGGRTFSEVSAALAANYPRDVVEAALDSMVMRGELFAVNKEALKPERRWRILQ
jgi:hypothetical protein